MEVTKLTRKQAKLSIDFHKRNRLPCFLFRVQGIEEEYIITRKMIDVTGYVRINIDSFMKTN